MGRFVDLLGTVLSAFKIGRATLSASALTAQRSFALPDKDGTFALLDDIGGGGGGGFTWTTVSANTAMSSGSAYVVTGARGMTLPASVSPGDWFIVHAYDATVRVVSNGNVINGVGSGNDLTLAAGETVYLVGRSTGNLEIV